MKSIKLPCGSEFLIDDEDETHLADRLWFGRKSGSTFYVVGRPPGHGQKEITLVRLILGLKDGEKCNYKNKNGLDCRKQNMQRCTQAEIAMNMGKKRGYKPFKGVFFDRRRGMYYAQIAVTKNGERKRYWRGVFKKPEDAAVAYDALAVDHHGEFARLNFPQEAA